MKYNARSYQAIFSVCLILLTSQIGYGQGSIVLDISDSYNQSPLGGVTVIHTLEDKTLSVNYSSDDGLILYNNLSFGKHTFQIELLGYKPLFINKNLSDTGNHTISVELNHSAFTLNSVEVIGERNSALTSMPGTGTKLSKVKIESIAPIGIQELLEYVPGINGFADDGIGNSRINIGIRGINPRRSSRTLVLEDGIPIQPALYVYSNMYYNPPVERIEEIEIIKGSGSILYGPHTMGGVINYITKRPVDYFNGSVQGIVGNNGFQTYLFRMGGFGSKKIKPEFQLLYKSGSGFRENNDFEQLNGTIKFLFVPNENRKIYLNINGNYEKSNATYTGLTEFSFANDPTFNPKEDDEFTIHRYAVNAIQQRIISKNLEENTKLYFNFFDRDWWRELDMFTSYSDYVSGNYTEVPLAESNNYSDLIRVGNGQTNFGILRRFYVAGLEHKLHWKQKFKGDFKGYLNFGGRIHFERFIDVAVSGNAPDARSGIPYRANNYETYAIALFAEEKFEIDDLSITIGLRLEAFEQEVINRLNNNALDDATTVAFLPGLGFNYQIKGFNVFGGIHRGMTPPSNSTLFMLNFGETDNTDYDGLKLKAETSLNNEIGVRYFGHLLDFEVAGFQINIRDMIAAARGTSFTNIDKVTSSGIETFLNLKFSEIKPWLPNVSSTYTYLKTDIENGVLARSAINDTISPNVSGNSLPYAPKHNLILGLGYSLKNTIDIDVNYRYVSRCYSDYENIDYAFNRGDTGPIPSYWLLNATIQYKYNNTLRIFLTGKNLLDKVYIGSRLHSNPRSNFASSSSGIMPGMRRQINLGINYNF